MMTKISIGRCYQEQRGTRGKDLRQIRISFIDTSISGFEINEKKMMIMLSWESPKSRLLKIERHGH